MTTDQPAPSSPRDGRDGDMLDRNLHTLLGQAGDPATIEPGARARIRAGLVARVAARAPAPRSTIALAGWGLALAATGAVAIATVTGGDEGGKPAAPPVAATPASDSRTLADGTTIELGDGGTVRELGPRRIRVTGKVFLDVVPGQGTFTVETAQGQLAVLGTRFVVDAQGDQTIASVLRGAVAMRSSAGEEIIRAGEEGTMTARTAPVRRPAPRLSHLVSWVAERRKRDEKPPTLPARSGVLVARNPTFQEQEFPLPLRALTVDVHLENQVARVALDQTFYNPQPQTLEGVYKFALPPGAAVARLAMYVDGRLTESAVVERMAARRIYEDIVYQRRDPALLEMMGASKVSLRVFPLNPLQDKRLVLAYTQPLARTYDDVTLTVPLPDLEEPVADVDLRVRVVGCGGCELVSPSHQIAVERTGADAVVTYHGKGERLGDSLILRMRQADAPVPTAATTIADGKRYLLLRARPELGAAVPVAERPHRWVILDDTSASRGPVERRAQAELIDRLVQEIDEHDQVMVVAFDATHRRFAGWQDALAVDRAALARFLAKDAGLGETDLATSLAGAGKLLDGAPGYVVYVGDGTATGEQRTIDALRDALRGTQATFVGLGVGDGVDLPTLDALADATGGLAAHIDLGDDLAWRALDVVASLYTPRLTGLVADVAIGGDAADQGLVTAYLRSRQVAAGEDLEIVVAAPARDDLETITVRGLLAGAPWQRTFKIAELARAAGDAGYLPRLWAERRLDALVTAGDRALAPCVTTPCPSDEERAIAAYHARKAEMVALGKAHFLLSQHTSLLVLENDAMYRQYGVEKGSGATWAPYQLPATIAVTTVAAPVTDDGPVWRAPLTELLDPRANLQSALAVDKEYKSAGFGLDATGGTGWGTIGTGRYGTIGHGSGTGTGTGYGVGGSGAGPGGGGAGMSADPTSASAQPAMVAADEVGDAPSGSVAVEANKSFDVSAGLATGPTLELREAAGGLLSPPPPPAERAVTEAVGAGFLGRRQAEGDDDRSRGLPMDLQWEGANLRSSGEEFGQNRWSWQSSAMPMAYLGSGSWQLDDLTAWLPGLARMTYDDLAAQLDATAGSATGSITDDARRALTEARGTLRPGRWRLGGDAEVVLDRAGRIERSRTLDNGAREVLTYDGQTLTVSYPDLGLASTRAVGDHEPALLGALLPLVPPRPEHLARWYQVTLSGSRTIRLAPARGQGPVIELDLGDDGAIAQVRHVDGGVTTQVMTVTRAGAGFELAAGGQMVSVGYQVDDAVGVTPITSAAVTLTLPLRAEGHWQRALAAMTASAPGWRTTQHQRAAAALAIGNPALVAQIARELVTAGPLSAAEQALLGGAVMWADPATRSALTAGGKPVADYLAAAVARRDGRGKGWGDFADVAASRDGLVATLAGYRAALEAIERGSYRPARAAFDRLLDRKPASLVALMVAQRLVQNFAWQDADALTALDRVAVGIWRNQARAQAALQAGYAGGYGRGARADGGARWVALIEDVDLAALPPVIDGNARMMVVNGARGEVGWRLAMTAWRQRVLAAGDFAHVMAFARAAMLDGGDDLDAALDRAMTLAGTDADALTTVVVTALGANRVDRLPTLLATARARAPHASGLIRLASQTAERRGEPAEAARLQIEAMTAEGDRPIALSTLRGEYGRLLRLLASAVKSTSGAARDQAIEAALAAGRDWRALDPDLPARERQLGELLFAVGRDDEGWRYLSTPIDRAPREGASFASAAEGLEAQGKLDRALGLWRRAFAIDATNPTWLMRAAQVELALGRSADAQATIARITDRTWHNRFWSVTSWAQQARAPQPRPPRTR